MEELREGQLEQCDLSEDGDEAGDGARPGRPLDSLGFCHKTVRSHGKRSWLIWLVLHSGQTTLEKKV